LGLKRRAPRQWRGWRERELAVRLTSVIDSLKAAQSNS